jgi:hypothetical protein
MLSLIVVFYFMITACHQLMPLRCASCISANAFGDIASDGINGSTTRHAMRLINSRFARENKFFGMKEQTH